LAPGQHRKLKVESPFFEELSGIGIGKFLIPPQNVPETVSIKLVKNKGTVDITNGSKKTVHWKRNQALAVLDIRSMGYFQVDHGVLTDKLTPKYQFVEAQELCTSINETFQRMRTAEISAHHTSDSPLKSKDRKGSKSKLPPKDPYPWMEQNDVRRDMSDEEILRKYIDLSKSDITFKEKERVREAIWKRRKAFSLRDEIGQCPNIEIDIDLIDDSPFFVRPFPIREEDKPVMDWQMERLVHLGILTKECTSYTSPVMLITRKVTKDKRPVVDFRLLNTRIKRKNTSSPLMKDIFNILGNSQCELLSCIDLKDAYHSIKLSEKAKDLCGIMPYMGGDTYRFNVLPMGLSISPAKWIEYINMLIGSLKDAIMDDLLIHSKKKDHFARWRQSRSTV
jgi:hypothetical protein